MQICWHQNIDINDIMVQMWVSVCGFCLFFPPWHDIFVSHMDRIKDPAAWTHGPMTWCQHRVVSCLHMPRLMHQPCSCSSLHCVSSEKSSVFHPSGRDNPISSVQSCQDEKHRTFRFIRQWCDWKLNQCGDYKNLNGCWLAAGQR